MSLAKWQAQVAQPLLIPSFLCYRWTHFTAWYIRATRGLLICFSRLHCARQSILIRGFGCESSCGTSSFVLGGDTVRCREAGKSKRCGRNYPPSIDPSRASRQEERGVFISQYHIYLAPQNVSAIGVGVLFTLKGHLLRANRKREWLFQPGQRPRIYIRLSTLDISFLEACFDY